MPNPNIGDDIRSIEKAIDFFHQNLNLHRIKNRSLARWYLLLMHEEMIRIPPLLRAQKDSDWSEHIGPIEYAKGGLKYALHWTDDLLEDDFKIPQIIDQTLYEDAKDFLDCSINYYGIIAPFVLFGKGLARAELVNPTTLKFMRDETDASFETLEHIFRNSPDSPFVKSAMVPFKQEIDKAFNDLENLFNNAAPDGPEGVKYHCTHKDIKPLMLVLEQQMLSTSHLGDEWSLCGIKKQHIIKSFAFLKARVLIHLSCINRAAGVYGITGMGSVSSLLVLEKEGLNRLMAKTTGIDLDIVKKFTSIMVYDENLKQKDIALQPLLPISNERILLAPNLIAMNNMERNFLALTAKLFKSEYDNASHHFELKMINQCENIANRYNLKFSAKKKIRSNNQLPDIDVAFYEKSSNVLLLCECKVIIAPSEPSEIIERNKRELEGCEQANEIKKYSKTNAELIWQSCFPSNEYPTPKFYFVVLLNGHFGSKHSIDAAIPAIELDFFSALLDKFKTLNKVAEYLVSFEYLPKKGKDFEIVETKLTFGKYTIIWQANQLKSKTDDSR
ncbi:MAG: hypothetical protein WC484_05415 [Candidatus Omnitrophota bacterium]